MRFRGFLLALCCCVVAAPARADEFDDAVKDMQKALKDKSKVDVKHCATVLGERFKDAKPEQQKIFFVEMKKAASFPDKESHEAVLEALSKSDARAVDILSAELEKAKDDVPTQGQCLIALGKLKDVKAGLPIIKKQLNNKAVVVVSRAVDALLPYKDADFAAKKDIVGDLLKLYGSISSAAEKQKPTTTDKDRLEKTRESFENTLKALTGQTDKTGFGQWSKWWNETGKKADKW